jgi:pimeloyl-ACP methyl ester carboxylesterase
MNPEVRYARTSDGVSIAYFAAGTGPLLIDTNAPPFCNAELNPRIAEYRAFFEDITRRITYVQYDTRGFGMSDREITDFSLAAMVKDIEAVADALGHDRFAMAAWSERGMPTLAYAAAHPERVIAIALREGFGSVEGSVRSPEDLPLQLARDN